MRLLLAKQTYPLIKDKLAKLGIPLEIVTMDETGGLWEGDKAVDVKTARPEVVWITGETMSTKQFAPLLALTPQFGTVKLLQTLNTGLDAPGYRGVFDAGIRVSNSDAQAISIAEYVVGNVLGEWQQLSPLRAQQARHEWKRTSVPLREISQSSWLIIGFGNIGRETAKRAAAFGAEIVGVRSKAGTDELAREVATQDDLPRLLPQADVVVLACPLTARTRNMADAKFFAAMKPGSVLVNIARGQVIDEAAMMAALNAGKPETAILDVFVQEPLPADSPFWDHPRVRLTSHTSASGSGTGRRREKLFLDNLAAYAKGQKLRNEVPFLP